jgi:hypothetical protein
LSFGINRLDFVDIDEEIAAELGIQLLFQVFDASALAADDDARFAGGNSYQSLVIAFALDLNTGNAGFESTRF